MKSAFLIASIVFLSVCLKAQNRPDVLSYYINGTPANGVKIKTNIPFSSGVSMPTIMIEGFSYSTTESFNLTLNFYVFGSPAVVNRAKVSSAGGATPAITLANENGKVSIFIDSKASSQRFHIRAYGAGLNADTSAATYTGWTAVDSLLISSATAVTSVAYENRFTGDVYMPGNSVFNSAGNVGIGTTAPGTYKLAVEGTIGARRLQIKQTSWADFVFAPGYALPDLDETESYIKENQHLPGIPSATEVQKEGIDVGDMNKQLLQKVEELTLYIIEQNKRITALEKSNMAAKQ
jgi:hypothetical protein